MTYTPPLPPLFPYFFPLTCLSMVGATLVQTGESLTQAALVVTLLVHHVVSTRRKENVRAATTALEEMVDASSKRVLPLYNGCARWFHDAVLCFLCRLYVRCARFLL